MKAMFLGLLLLLFAGAANAVPVLDVSGGILMGARGVDVNGVLYDVSFQDGTCINLYSGCDALTDFPFTSAAGASAASQALLDQVLVDGAAGSFDSVPSLINGCGDNTGQGFCAIFTAADTLVNNTVAQNSSLEIGDLVKVAFTLSTENLSIYDTVVYAVWAPTAVGTVPEPSSAALLVAGLLASVFARRRFQAGRRA